MKPSKITKQIIQCEKKVDRLWSTVLTGKRKIKREDRIRREIHHIHVIESILFQKLWNEYRKGNSEAEKIEGTLWCDGNFHFRVNNKGKLQYGINCNCE